MASKDGVAQAPCLVLSNLGLQNLLEPLLLLGHPYNHIEYIERIEHNFEILIGK